MARNSVPPGRCSGSGRKGFMWKSLNIACKKADGGANYTKECSAAKLCLRYKVIELDFDKSGGLIPAIAQDVNDGAILMTAYINQEAWEETLSSGQAVYFSRSRSKLWRKGEESGNLQLIREILVDCDGDAVVFKVEQIGGAACHTGHRSCFFRKVESDALVEIAPALFDPAKKYKKQS